MILKGYIFAILYAFICLLTAFFVYKLGMPKKYSRKLVHILVGAEWIILYHYMGASYHFLIVCILFLALLSFSYFANAMPMISSEDDNAPGTVYYALAMSIMSSVCLFIPDMLIPFGIGVFATSLGDGFAGIVGQLCKNNPKLYKNKSIVGTLTNFAVSSAVAIVFRAVFDMNMALWQCFAIGLLSSGLELVTGYGLDNISVTLGASFLAYSFVYYPLVCNYIVPILLTPFIIAVVLEKKALTGSAVLLAVILDAVVSLTLGNFGFVLIFVFLFGSIVIDKIKKRAYPLDKVNKRGDCRDCVQVIANGLIPMMSAILFSITLNKAFIIAYIASVAEAFSDTAASGVGAYSQKAFDVFKMRYIKRGLSGGISLIGTVASIVGAFVIGAIALIFGAVNLKLCIIASTAAFFGTLFDSFLGSVFQIKYKCTVCGELTEKEHCCNTVTEKYSGFAFFDNDVVNLFSGAFAALIGGIAYIAFS